jgi:hypothetical protein
MSAAVTHATRPGPTNPRSVDDWAEVISADIRRWHEAVVEAVIATGRHLQEAKDQLDHGEWLPLLERIEIEARTAQMLMKIAGHPVISNANHGSHLPPSWRTLAELARLGDEALEAAIEDGTVRPDMTRMDATVLLPAPKKRADADDADDADAGDAGDANDAGGDSPEMDRIVELVLHAGDCGAEAYDFIYMRHDRVFGERRDEAIRMAKKAADAWAGVANYLFRLKASGEPKRAVDAEPEAAGADAS